jgi:hypothetical protein
VTFGPQYKDQMSGVLRVVSNDRIILLELISITIVRERAALRVRHLTADLEPRDSAPLDFKLARVCERGATFANSAGDDASPQRSTYWIDDEDRLHVFIEGVKGKEGSRSYESILVRVQ